MPDLCRGRIVWVELLDPQGRNPTCRPAVIVSPDADIKEDGEVWVVGVSRQLDQAPPEVQVELPWHRDGHPRTKLKDRCVAVTTWMSKVKVDSIASIGGTVPGRQLLDIQKLIRLPESSGSP